MAKLTDQQIQELAIRLKSNPEEMNQFTSQVKEIASPSPKPRFDLGGALRGGLRGFAGEVPKEEATDSMAEKMLLEKYKADLSPKKWEPKSMDEAIEFEKAKGEAKPVTTAQLKFELEQQDKRKQQEEQSQLAQESMQDTIDTIAEVKNGINYFGAVGPVHTLNPWDYKRKKWETNINKLLSGKIIDVMTKMKQASKTGATGFGQLSNKELSVLKEASTALNKGLAPEDAMEYLNKMEAILARYSSMGGSGGGGQLMVDAQGNKAMVYPDGRIEEIQ